MGEKQNEPFQFTFNGFLKSRFRGRASRPTLASFWSVNWMSTWGWCSHREHLSDSLQGLNTQFRLADLLRQSVYSRLAGYEDLNDAARLSADPTFRPHRVAEDLGPRCGAHVDVAFGSRPSC